MELYIGQPSEKIGALESLLGFARRDKDLVKKAMTTAKQFAGETKIETMNMAYENWEMDLAKWSKELSSNHAPQKKEIDYFFPK